jgi:hypothetical protein
MHLSTAFADMIIKIRKESRQVKDVDDEVAYYGVIDDACVYIPSDDRKTWSNGADVYTTADFEHFLKKIS